MTIRNAKTRLKKRLERKARIKRITEYVVSWMIIILLVAAIMYPVQHLVTKHFVKRMQKENKTHITILIGDEKVTLEDVDVVYIKED